MLGTLLKYEFKAVGRILLPLFGAWLIAAALLGLSIGGDGGQSVLFMALTALLYGGVAMAALILTTIILIQRFYKNLLGNEGYLMFTLPVSTGQHIINKLLSASAWGTIGTVVAIASGILIAMTIEGPATLFEEIRFMVGDLQVVLGEGGITFLLMLEMLVVIFLAFGVVGAKVYAAIAVGHQWSNHRIMGAIIAYIGFGIIETIIGNIVGAITDNSWFYTKLDSISMNMSTAGFASLVMFAGIIICAIVAAIYGVISWLLLDRKLNLE